MNKKFLSAILFGALMVTSTGTFVSCKDYDDDIENLQDQINKLATKEDMTSQIASLQSALTAAQSEAAAAKASAEDALKKAQEALDNVSAGSDEAAKQAAQAAADAAQAAKDAADAKVEAIKAAQDEVAKVQAELEATIDSKFEAAKSEFAETIAALTKKVEEMTGYTTSVITSVSLLGSYAGSQVNNQAPALTFYTATEVDNTFGPNKELTFTKGTKVEWSDKLLVRVSPTNAVLTPEMVTLINSKGEEFGLAKVTSVTPYDKLITRSAANNGLWLVETALSSEYDEATFKAATKNQGNDILFAVAVSNNGDERKIISSYDVAVKHEAYTPARFDFSLAENADADFRALMDYKNRWNGYNATDDASSKAKEYKWADPSKTYAAPAENVIELDNEDARSWFPYLNVQVGVPFIVESHNTGIKSFYVTLDKDFAEEDSEPSEINIWNEYAKTMTGLNTMSKDGKVAITINNELANRDIIGFRVYAVNYDGTLTDPDGRAFYVAVGNSVAAESVKGEFTYVAKLNNGAPAFTVEGDTLATEIGDWAEKVKTITWTCNEPELKANNITPSWDIQLLGADKKSIITLNNNWSYSWNESYKKATSIAVNISASAFANFIDDYTYTGALNFLDVNGSVIKTVNVSYTKRLPDAPSFLKVKDGQKEGEVLNMFVLWGGNLNNGYSSNAAARMSEIFTGWSSGAKVTFETSAKKNDAYTEKVEVPYTGTDDKLVIDATLVDNETSHATKVEYTYAGISTSYNTITYQYEVAKDYKVTVDEFNTTYNCIFHKPNYTFDWATKLELGLTNAKDVLPYKVNADGIPVFTYGKDPQLTENVGTGSPNSGIVWAWEEVIFGHSKYYPVMYTANYDTFVNRLNYHIDSWASNVGQQAFFPETARVNSGGTLEEDYFKVTVNSANATITIVANTNYASSAPKNDVPSTLEITGKDHFGHEMTISLPVIVSPAE